MPIKTSNNKSAWSAKDIYDMIFSTYGNAHVNANEARAKEASKYMIPYIPEKEIMLTTGRYNTGKISTNLLDSIYNASQRTGVPLDIALGLAGRESTLGIGRGFKKGKSVSGTDLYSNWQQIQTIPNNKAQMKRWNSLLGRTDLTDEDYDFKSEFLMRAQDSLENTKPLDENPIDNALKFYQTGKYNPGDSRHNQMVEDDAKALMSDPAIQKWLKTKTETQMKCGGRRKAELGLAVTDGGTLTPIAPNMYLAQGRTHDDGGIGISYGKKYNAGGNLEIEDKEILQIVGGNTKFVGNGKFKSGGQEASIRVFSSVPFLRGVSPAELVLGGANPDTVFKAQEEFKDKNRINDDGTRYEVGGEKRIYTPSKSIQRQIQETGKITIGGAPTIGGLRTYKYLRGLTNVRKYADKGNLMFDKLDNLITKNLQSLINKRKISVNQGNAYKGVYNQIVGEGGINIPRTASLFLDNDSKEMKAGGIYIKPSKRGTFTAAATKHGMGVQEFASKVLANKEDYSSAMVKKANFARNASRWKKEYGGSMIYTINGNVKNGLSLRPKATLGTKKEDEEKKKKNPNEARYASRVQKGQAQEVTAKPVVEYNEAADKNPDKNRYTRAAGFKAGEAPASPDNNQKEKDDNEKAKDARWIGQYKPVRTEDWIGLGSNLVGSVASYFMTKNAINKTPNPIKPVMAQAAKLKTKYNVEPQLTEVREAEQMNRAAVRRNTQSSNTSLVREQRLMNEARGARNTLYGQKENIETQLINQDRLNRQTVYQKNVDTYNNYLNRVYLDKQHKAEARISNINNLIGGLTGSVNNMLNTIETRRATNNTLRAIAAANPNVDARLIGGFDYYEAIGPDGKRKALYDKHQKFVRYI